MNSLLCTVDELVLIGPLKAGLHSFVVPKLLCVIKELLRKRKANIKKQTTKRLKLECIVMMGRSGVLNSFTPILYTG